MGKLPVLEFGFFWSNRNSCLKFFGITAKCKSDVGQLFQVVVIELAPMKFTRNRDQPAIVLKGNVLGHCRVDAVACKIGCVYQSIFLASRRGFDIVTIYGTIEYIFPADKYGRTLRAPEF